MAGRGGKIGDMKPPTIDDIPFYPSNPEHREAAQEDANQRRAAYKASLPEIERNKLDAIEKASEMLEAAGVEFFLSAESAPLVDGNTGRWVFHWFDCGSEEERPKKQRDYAMKTLSSAADLSETCLGCGVLFRFLSADGKSQSGPYFGRKAVKIINRTREA